MQKLGLLVLVIAAMAGGFFVSQQMQKPADTAPSAARTLALPRASTDSVTSGVDYELPDLDGNAQTLSASDGDVRVLNFWATWCAPCRREIPLLKALQEEHGDAGIKVIGLAVDERDPVAQYAADTEFNYPILMAEPGADQLVDDYGLDFIGLPLTLIVAPDRELVYAHAGEMKVDELEPMLATLKALAAGDIDAAAARDQLNAL